MLPEQGHGLQTSASIAHKGESPDWGSIRPLEQRDMICPAQEIFRLVLII